MRTYEKPAIDILVTLPYPLLDGLSGNDPNRDNDDEDGGTMGNTSFFDDVEYDTKNKLWED